MEPFLLTLSNGAKLSGLHSLPSTTPATPTHLPLIVAIHGGTYSSKYFDALPSTSAGTTSSALGIPFIAIDRPGYKSSTGLPPVGPGGHFLQEEGKYLHRYILPKIWEEFGKKTGSTTIVLLNHSMACPGAMVATASYATEKHKSYPLGGLIMSGWGVSKGMPEEKAQAFLDGKTPSDRLEFPLDLKDMLMLGPPEMGRAEPKIYEMTEFLGTSMSYGEFYDGNMHWLNYWLEFAKKINVPIMYGLGENDALWPGKEEYVQEFARAFTSSPRVERGLILGAPHSGELSYWGRGWLLRCFGFAAECATAGVVG
jgi:pimeloyl-ACP methyl ester carboxylesterase